MKKIPRMEMIARDDWLTNKCKGKRVLHVGCADYPITKAKIDNGFLLHARLAPVCKEIVGVDIDQNGISMLSKLMPNHEFIHHNIEELDECRALSGKIFDVIVAADVYEHIYNPGRFLEGARKLLSPSGELLLTTPNAFSIKRMIPMAFWGFEYVHPDHVGYFSVCTLIRMLNAKGFNLKGLHAFQWHQPTFRNWFANTSLLPLLYVTGGRLCDELAMSFSPTPSVEK